MATVWRSYNHRARLGIDVSVPTPGYGASSIVLTVNYYIQMEWNGQTANNASIPLSGAITGNLDQRLDLGNSDVKHLGTRTLTVNLTGSTQTRSFGIAATHFGPGWSGTTTYSPGLTVTIPARRAVPVPSGFAASRGVNWVNVLVSWGNPITYSSRRLERRVNGGGWSYLAAPTGTSFTDTTALPGNKYEYRIRGTANGTNSSWSAIRAVTWTFNAPSNMRASRSGGTANLSWNSSENVDVTRIERRTNNGAWSYLSAPSGTSYADTTIVPGNKYEYRVQFILKGISSAFSNIASVTWNQDAPYNLTVSRSGGTASLSWSRGEAADSYRVERRTNWNTWEQIAAPSGNGTTYSATGLVAGSYYHFRVRDMRKGVFTGYSNVVAALFPPVAPSAVSVSRASDTQHTITVGGGSTRTSLVIRRTTNGGEWVTVATPAGNISSWTDTSTAADRRYQYAVAIATPGGQSSWVYSSVLYTTPRVPTGVSATRSGDNISVNASGRAPYATDYDTQEEGWQSWETGPLPYVHPEPPVSRPYRYRVRARVNSGTSNPVALVSAWSGYSNFVQLAAPPNAPTGLAPNGAVSGVGESVVLSWQHNPVDSSVQSAYELRYRQTGGVWTTLSGSSEQSHPVLWPVDNHEWQVRTKGVHPDWSPWSAIATATVIDLPTVTVLEPDMVLERPTILVEWGYAQAQDRPQSSWELQLMLGAETVASLAGNGATASVTLNTRAVDGETYTVRVRAATGSVWGEWASSIFDVAYLPPDDPVGFGDWNETDGVVDLFVRPGDDVDAPETTHLSIERSLDGEEWVPIIFDTAGDHSVADGEGLSNGVTYYRFTAFTFDGVTAATVIEVESDSEAIWISGGEGFGIAARLLYSPEFVEEAGREGGVVQFAGRSRFWAWRGSLAAEVLQVSGVILHDDVDTAQISDVKRVFNVATPVFLYRDPSGRHVYGSVSRVTLPRHSSKHSGYSFELTETDH